MVKDLALSLQSSGHYCGEGLIHSLGTSTYHRGGKKKKKTKKEKERERERENREGEKKKM